MLRRRRIKALNASQKGERPYDGGHLVQGIVLKLVVDVDLKLVALRSVGIEMQRETCELIPTLFARITGPGKTPEASVALGYTGSDTVSSGSRGRLTCEGIHQELCLR